MRARSTTARQNSQTQMIDKINKILSEWDPIEVGYPISLDEYTQYAPKIKTLLHDEEKLKYFLGEILAQMGLGYDSNNSDQKQEIDRIAKKLSRVENG